MDNNDFVLKAVDTTLYVYLRVRAVDWLILLRCKISCASIRGRTFKRWYLMLLIWCISQVAVFVLLCLRCRMFAKSPISSS